MKCLRTKGRFLKSKKKRIPRAIKKLFKNGSIKHITLEDLTKRCEEAKL